MAPPLQHLEGRKFHKLVAIERAGFREGTKCRKTLWRCLCDCGKEAVVAQVDLLAGATKSCGCIIGKHKRTHGMTGTPEFRTWDAMRRRCNNPQDKNYFRYGGRGIKVCERWERFEHFYADMGPRPSGKHSLDRIDNDGNYEPGNCRWTDDFVQCNNRRTNVFIEFNGERKTISEWERQYGHKPGRVWTRLSYGWSVERAITEPSRRVSEWDRASSAITTAGIAC